MEFRTQYGKKRKFVPEETGFKTMVTQVPSLTNAEKLAQMQLTGQLIEAQRVGYEYDINEVPVFDCLRPGRGADITTVLDFIQNFGQRIRKHISSYHEEQAKAAEERRKSLSNAQEGGKDVSEPKT